MFAAATASWIARLMPIPPIGDMACAASPIASRPGRCQQRQPVELDGQQVQVADLVELGEVELGRRGAATSSRIAAIPRA